MKVLPIIILLLFSCESSNTTQFSNEIESNDELLQIEIAQDSIITYKIESQVDSLILDYAYRFLEIDSSYRSVHYGFDNDSVKLYNIGIDSGQMFVAKHSFYQLLTDELFYISPNSDTILIHPKVRRKVTLVPCSNGYLYSSQGICVNDDLNELLKSSDLDFHSFPLRTMKGAGFSGIYNLKDAGRIIKKIDFDILILTRMYGYEYSNENLGYTIKLIDVNGSKEIVSIGKKVIGTTYEDVKDHLNKNLSQLIRDIEAI